MGVIIKFKGFIIVIHPIIKNWMNWHIETKDQNKKRILVESGFSLGTESAICHAKNIINKINAKI
jgi:hypothetical protein